MVRPIKSDIETPSDGSQDDRLPRLKDCPHLPPRSEGVDPSTRQIYAMIDRGPFGRLVGGFFCAACADKIEAAMRACTG